MESKYRNDFKWFPCKTVAVDGGLDYTRIIREMDNLIKLHEYEKDEKK
ncbi:MULTISPECIES: DUF7695 domain-containing protein [Bacillus cereus group]